MQPTAADAGMRPFGLAADLDLDLRSPDRPQLVTTLLVQCSARDDAEFWWSRSVSARVAGLLRLVWLTERRESIDMSARCAGTGCGELFEFALPLAALGADACDERPIQVLLEGSRAVSVRRPTGHDLRRWRAMQPDSRRAAVQAMLDALSINARLEVDDAAAVAAALAANDGLVDFTVKCACPACGADNEVAVDLESLALQRLHARQARLLDEVHHLASRYGWTEQAVLAVPAWRRARYFALIESEQ